MSTELRVDVVGCNFSMLHKNSVADIRNNKPYSPNINYFASEGTQSVHEGAVEVAIIRCTALQRKRAVSGLQLQRWMFKVGDETNYHSMI